MFPFHSRSKMTLAVATGLGTTIGLAFWLRRYGLSIIRKLSIKSDPFKDMVISVATTEDECVKFVQCLRNNLKSQQALGFDCEWVQRQQRNPVALVQLATSSGECVLFHLYKLKGVPESLKEILEDPSIIKLGLDPLQDAKYLRSDYGVQMAGTMDIRHICKRERSMGLAAIVERELGVVLFKGREVRASNWEHALSERQMVYAAKDAFSSVLVFNKVIPSKACVPYFASEKDAWTVVEQYCVQFLDVAYGKSYLPNGKVEKFLNGPLKRVDTFAKPNGTKSFRGYCLRKNPLYENCMMLAPDGEALSTCDVKKAEWYVSKGLARVVQENPYWIQLNFEPSGRAVGESGQYYTLAKENQCVVCGRKDSYLRKKVVPQEYRKYFPESMKAHQSHDILLLCIACHVHSNAQDLNMRQKLAECCNAPIMTNKVTENRAAKQLRSAARALLKAHDHLPEERKEELTDIILAAYPSADVVTPELLEELKDIVTQDMDGSCAPHGQLVVEHFAKQGAEGLMELERMWRVHFLKTMKPKFLPPLWSIDHYHEEDRIHRVSKNLHRTQ